MNPSEIQRERELFGACLDRQEPERAAFLALECAGDQELQGRVEELLRAHAMSTRDFRPVATAAAASAGPPEVIGRYRITGVLGEGGMGTVYAADQLEPVQRRVALKVIRCGPAPAPGAGSILARFATEQQALAVMDHPHVAKVFDGGETSQGNPYFAMELVSGEPLTRFCDEHRLSVRSRIALFLQLCGAVQHAHQKGVVHRDLKPANVLVGISESGPSVKVIDFGIAKAVGSEALAARLTTAGAPVGTPAYMSPEQAGAHSGDIDTRSDIYSLGVILYELLTGALPADPEVHGCARFLALLGSGGLAIGSPSSKASSPALRRQIEGDLDWIAMRALDSERGRRYPSASALADDLERYLADQPVSARPPSRAYRIGKFCRRYRYQVAAAGMAIVALIAGAAAAATGHIRAARAEASAREEAASAREIADFLVGTFKLADPGETRGRTVTARELLDNAAAGIDSSVSQSPAIRRRLLGSLSSAYGSLGLHRERLDLARKASSAIAPPGRETLAEADALLAFGSASHATSGFDAAGAALTRCIAIRTRLLGPRHTDVATAQVELANLYISTDRFEPAMGLLEDALSIRRAALGPHHIETGRTLRMMGILHARRRQPGAAARARDYYAQALAIVEAVLGRDHLETAQLLGHLGRAEANPREAAALAERGMAIRTRLLGPKHTLVAESLFDLGRAYNRLGQFDKGRSALLNAMAIREAAFGPASWQVGLCLQALGFAEAGRKGNAAAWPFLARAYAIHNKEFGPDHSMTLNLRNNLGLIALARNLPDEALPHLQAALRGGFYFDWKDDWFDRVRTDRRFLALLAEQERRQKEKPAERQWSTQVH